MYNFAKVTSENTYKHTNTFMHIFHKRKNLVFVAEEEAFQMLELNFQGGVVLSHPLQAILDHHHLFPQEMHSLLQPPHTLPTSAVLVIPLMVLHLPTSSSLQQHHYRHLSLAPISFSLSISPPIYISKITHTHIPASVRSPQTLLL